MKRHYSAADLFAFIEGNNEVVNVDDVSRHLERCSKCAALLDDLKAFGRFVGEAIRWIDAERATGEPLPISGLLGDSERLTGEAAVAEEVVTELMSLPVESWPAYFREHPAIRTEGLIRRLIDEAVGELDREAEKSLVLLDHAEEAAAVLLGDASSEYRSEIRKNRANALRMLGRYDEALAEADRALMLAASSPTGAFAHAQAVYTRGAVLFKMGRLAEARESARDAADSFSEFGDLRRAIHARTLQAAAATEQGDIAYALAVYLMIRPQAQYLGDAATAARITANIAVGCLRVGRYSEAREYAEEARAEFQRLRVDAEVIRADWTLGAISIAVGARRKGLSRLTTAAAAFERLDMLADAGFVKLDIVEELLRGRRWSEAEAMARECAETFSKSGARLHLTKALAYLREAVERRHATPGLVQYVRTYVAADDPDRPFSPPFDPVS